jgi:membrane-bound lytic murein transglycosylase D
MLAACLCTPLATAAFAQTQPAANYQRQEVQRVIDRSNEQFQRGEEHFQNANYDQARRAYDKAMDLILESGLSDPQLSEYYRRLTDKIFQRQMGLKSNAPVVTANNNQSTLTQNQNPVTATPAPQEPQAKQGANGANGEGFGQQNYVASPLDEVSKLKLSEEETKPATNEQMQSAITAAKLDFNFKPHPLVQGYINYYNGRGRATMETGLRRSGRFIAMARRIFKEENVPQDLVWLCQVESAWSPIARSWAAAVGLWQFIPGTGSQYGLKQDYWVDERSSFEKATRASAKYLRWLANRYAGNWELAMAAYNSGEGRVDGCIARTGYADFWEIYPTLPNETKNYVPNILAVIIIAKNQARYGFNVKPENPLAYEYVTVNNAVDLHLVADAVDASYDYLLALNPELKRGVTPPAETFALRVPPGRGKVLQAALNRIPPDRRTQWRMMTAMNSDTFEAIARRTGVSESTLEQVNGGVLRPGAKVIIPANGGLRNVVFSTPARTSSRGAAAAPVSAGVAPSTARSMAKIVTYKAKEGESLGDVAGRYNVSVRDLATLNRLSASAKLKAGQMVQVPVKGR